MEKNSGFSLGGNMILKFLWELLRDERGTTLNVTYSFSPNTLISSTEMNTNFNDVEAVVNALTSDNLGDDSVTAAKLNADVVRATYGLIMHTDGSLYVDVSDTNPCLELTDGGLRVKVDDSSIERASGGLQVKALGVTAAMLAGTITDDKLSQIVTASKVSGTALTSLANIPAEAGVIPAANLPAKLGTYDSGYFAVADGQSYVKTHNLGTTKVLITLYFATQSNGSDAMIMSDSIASNVEYGLSAMSITTTQVSVVAGHDGFIMWVPGGDGIFVHSGYARIVMLALE